MPKKIPITEMRKWLNSYEEGNSQVSIADAAHRDVRTVKKGIEQARLERDVQMARAELLKGALRDHQADLFGVVDNMQSALRVPDPNLSVPRQKPFRSKPLQVGRAALWFGLDGLANVSLVGEETLVWGLLTEHLRRDTIWGLIKQWKGKLAAHVEARIALKVTAVALLKRETGLDIFEEKPPQGGFIYASGLDRLFLIAVHWALGVPDTTIEDAGLVAQPEGRVLLGTGKVIAEDSNSPEQCRDGIVTALRELRTSVQAMRVDETYKGLREETDKSLRTIEELRMLRLIPGTCRICSRLGM